MGRCNGREPEHVLAGQEIQLVARSRGHPRHCRSACNARRIHAFTVPSGALSRAAIWACDTVDVRERNAGPLGQLELFHAARERLDVDLRREPGEIRRRVRHLFERRRIKRMLVAQPAHDGDRPMAQHGMDPAAGRAALGIERVRLLPDLHEGVVDGVLGQVAAPQHSRGHPEEPRRLPLVERLQRRGVAARAPRQRCLVVELRAGHRLDSGQVARWVRGHGEGSTPGRTVNHNTDGAGRRMHGCTR